MGKKTKPRAGAQESALGAAIGFGEGSPSARAGCDHRQIGIGISRGAGGAVVGGGRNCCAGMARYFTTHGKELI